MSVKQAPAPKAQQAGSDAKAPAPAKPDQVAAPAKPDQVAAPVAEPKAKPAEAEVLDCGSGPSVPSWENPDILQSLVASDDDKEGQLASDVVRLQYTLEGHLKCAKDARGLTKAKSEFRVAKRYNSAFLAACRNLFAYRSGGQQEVIKVAGNDARIAGAHKIEQFRAPQPASPDWYLLACLKNVGECFRIAATLLEGQARSAQVQVDFREGKSTTYNSHQLGATPNQVLQWQELSVSAYAEVAKIDKFWLTLKRGGRQVVMLSETTMAKADTIRRRQKGGRQVVMNSQATMAKADTISRRQKGGHGPLSQH